MLSSFCCALATSSCCPLSWHCDAHPDAVCVQRWRCQWLRHLRGPAAQLLGGARTNQRQCRSTIIGSRRIAAISAAAVGHSYARPYAGPTSSRACSRTVQLRAWDRDWSLNDTLSAAVLHSLPAPASLAGEWACRASRPRLLPSASKRQSHILAVAVAHTGRSQNANPRVTRSQTV